MSPRKLTEDDKQNMLELYRNSAATTSTLAAEFGVSSSTVSRFLKNSLSKEEYEQLIQQKRLARTTKGDRKKTEVKEVVESPVVQQKIIAVEQPTISQESTEETSDKKVINTEVPKVKRRRRRKAATTQEIIEEAFNEVIQEPIPDEMTEISSPVIDEKVEEDDDEEDDDDVDVIALSAILGEEIDDDEDEDDEDDDDDDDSDLDYPHTNSQDNDLEILPLANASLPRICYLVVDRAAELIVKPLQEFADLGAIPESEIQQKTLPVFDNHRVAKRFSHRREKVIKVPDGKMLQKTSHYLYDKGITRLLIRGQIYEISN